jgi:cell wall-associated NlpC family hydrolase
MNFGHKIVKAGRSRVGKPFQNHFKPDNLCDSGTFTLDSCINRGMSDEGYDCSGFIIACVAEAFGTDSACWPAELRHVSQMQPLCGEYPASEGDILVYYPELIDGKKTRTHIGIYVAEGIALHANGMTGVVDEGAVTGGIERVGVIPWSKLALLLMPNAEL